MIPITVFYKVIHNQSKKVIIHECVRFKNYEKVPKILPIYLREKYFVDLHFHTIHTYDWWCNPEHREFLQSKIRAKS